MNAPVHIAGSIRQTQAAEGLPRRAFTVADIERMVECGILDEDERVELVGGELVPMSPKGIRHEVLKRSLTQRWARLDSLHVLVETTLRLSDDTFVEPDFVLLAPSQPTLELTASDCLLIVELADSSLAYDLERKPALYAAAGVPELWVIDLRTLGTTVHRDPVGSSFSTIFRYDSNDVLQPTRAPDAAVTLGRLDLL